MELAVPPRIPGDESWSDADKRILLSNEAQLNFVSLRSRFDYGGAASAVPLADGTHASIGIKQASNRCSARRRVFEPQPFHRAVSPSVCGNAFLAAHGPDSSWKARLFLAAPSCEYKSSILPCSFSDLLHPWHGNCEVVFATQRYEAGLQLQTIFLEFDRYETAVAARKRKPITKRCRRSAPLLCAGNIALLLTFYKMILRPRGNRNLGSAQSS